MNLFLLQNCGRLPLGEKKKDKAKNLAGLYNKMMRQMANHLQSNTEKKGVDTELRDLVTWYCENVGLKPDWPSGCVSSGWRADILNEAARRMATMHDNHIQVNLETRFSMRYLKMLLRSKEEYISIRELPKKIYAKVFSTIRDAFYEGKKVLKIAKRRPSVIKLCPLDSHVWGVAQDLTTRLRNFIPSKGASLSRKSQTMFDIMMEVEPFSDDLQQRFLNGEASNGKFGKQTWKFNMCPQLSWRPKHIHISTTAVVALLKDMAKKHSHFGRLLRDLGGITDEKYLSYEKKLRLWSALFKLKKTVLRQRHVNNQNDCRFGCFISTDGVSVAATIQRRKSKAHCDVIRLNDDIAYLIGKTKTVGKGVLSSYAYGKWCLEVCQMRGKKGMGDDATALLPKPKDLIGEVTLPVDFLVLFSRIYPLIDGLQRKRMNLLAGINKRNDQTLIHEDIKDLMQLEKVDGIYYAKCKVVGLDPGKKSAATWVYHDPLKQTKHKKWKGDEGEKTMKEERYDSGSIGGGEWRYLSGQKQYTAKMNKRMTAFCPSWRSLSSTKTVDIERTLAAYRKQVELWPQINNAFFHGSKWFQKQRMRKFCKRQKAMEDVVAKIAGTKNKEEQKKVIIAYGDGDKNGTLRGTAPMMSTKLFKKVSENCRVVVTNEFRTSKLCSCCHGIMSQTRKQFRMKRCLQNDCIRTVWDRDINASINILNLFLHYCYSVKDNGEGERLSPFKRKRGCDE
ncbi:hypothetical protein M9434_003399 [Picochlorum sp. BPE23]|nr:hypothetical protein M9434_003399 [Picochlorum sp. BPE23]